VVDLPTSSSSEPAELFPIGSFPLLARSGRLLSIDRSQSMAVNGTGSFEGLNWSGRKFSMRQQLRILLSAGLLTAASPIAEPQKGLPNAPQKQGAVEQISPKVGQEFKIKNISGTDVTVSIVEKDKKHHIRSTYHHGWEREVRDHAITNALAHFFISDRTINIIFPQVPDAKLVGAVYVINNHGEAVKVDDITKTDLTW
jgi:F420-0:gamma-glutamyl ligase-like protein